MNVTAGNFNFYACDRINVFKIALEPKQRENTFLSNGNRKSIVFEVRGASPVRPSDESNV